MRPTQVTNPQRNAREVGEIVRSCRPTDNVTNFFYIAAEYATLAVLLTAAVGFFEWREAWGLAWAWNVPVALLAIIGVGVVQHRLAGLVHEGAHYILFKNRKLNELASDLLCMFPLFSTTAQYRVMHLGHHDYVNDWDRDPELLNMGQTRMMDRFPMPVQQFLKNFYVRTLWPPTLFRYVWDNMYCITLGNAKHPYERDESVPPSPMLGKFRVTSLLGVAYIGSMVAVLAPLAYRVDTPALLAIACGMWLAASAVCLAIPSHWFFQQHMRPVVSSKTTSILRLGFITAVEVGVGWSRVHLGPQWGTYFYLLWVLPLFTSWPYFMLLRDLYQHANADDGRLTNSRVILVNPVLRWAMFIYGQDIHQTHHLYPTIPHYRLTKLHHLLMQNDPEYAANVIECEGVFWNRSGKPTALECVGPNAPQTQKRPHPLDSVA
jgi:fatty acid desaturase